MLYVFAGFPKSGLNAGGLRRFIEIENIGLLEEDPKVRYSNEGEHRYHMSSRCGLDGIGWRWFPESWSFGNGVTIHKTVAEYRKHVVILKDDNLTIVTEDHSTYEARWAPGTCPQESHVVHLTWCIFSHDLPAFAYERLRSVIEEGATPLNPQEYECVDEPGKHKSASRLLTFS